jgi:hypothetical protein
MYEEGRAARTRSWARVCVYFMPKGGSEPMNVLH